MARAYLLGIVAAFALRIQAQEMETVNGTIYSDNNFTFYVNGEFIARDPVEVIPHNAVNITFRIPKGQDVVFAITASDWSNETTGLEYANRCVGDGGLRAMFSNGVVTNSSWKCWVSLFGPVNWQDCYAAADRNNTLKVLPFCKQDSVPPLEGCFTRKRAVPEGWTTVRFDDKAWQNAIVWDEDYVGWGLPPTGCSDPTVYISPDVDANGNNLTCPRQLDWGLAQFIWTDDLDLDNILHCRFTLRASMSGAVQMASATIMIPLASLVALAFTVQ